MTGKMTAPQNDVLVRVKTIVSNTLAWDNHGCMPVGVPYSTDVLPELRRYREAGVNVVSLNVGFGEMDVADHFQTLASMGRWVSMQDCYMLIQPSVDLELAQHTGRLGGCFEIDGANAIGNQVSRVRAYHQLGVRWMLRAYNRSNRAGGGCQDDDDGLASFGRDVVREMVRVGMVVCSSHTGHRTARDVPEVATKPVVFSHNKCTSSRGASEQHPGWPCEDVCPERRCRRGQRYRPVP